MAHQYDPLRAPYAPALIDDLVKLRPAATLDVGCGTGKVAVALAAHGLSVLGLEPDARMAAIARAGGLAVEIATFEAWQDEGRQFDLVTCGNAWHWVNPALGFPKLAKVLGRGGYFAMCFAVDMLEESVAAALAPIYRAQAPGLDVFGDPASHQDVDPLAGISMFSSIEKRIYAFERTLTAEAWANLLATVSNHQRLGPERLAVLQQAIREAIEGVGGCVRSRCTTHLWLARR